ncbi:lipopolysaccharide biosynthesis protein [Rhodococcus zopfii]|uniref:Lipopolysaccharide biosynthesis protein n=1 Tax=Rhodococcus zopfii TaxID=43772 RepID=A0ABU3WSU9_9NOCA|nr:lipopolysaccharide biosynthesis protein [Rhodococcus zopfii]
MADSGLSWGIRWSGISMVGREVSRMVFVVLLARVIGPEAFGIVAQALVYVGVVGLLLDQGFSSALIQREHVEPDMPGAVVTVNLGVGAALTVLTVAIAPLWASFMRTPELGLVLVALAPCLIIRAASITPRAMLQREMEFRRIGIADITAALVGGAAGLVVALTGGSYWALVVQILVTDAVLAVAFLLVGAGHRPNLHFRRLQEIAAFSWRAFAAGILVNSVSRNIDNLLVGRFHGPQALAFYGLAYRLLLLPVQLASATVGAVLFPAFFPARTRSRGTAQGTGTRDPHRCHAGTARDDVRGRGCTPTGVRALRSAVESGGAHRPGSRPGRSDAGDLSAVDRTVDARARAGDAQPSLRLADHRRIHGRDRGGPAVRSVRSCRRIQSRDRSYRPGRVADPAAASRCEPA